MITGVDSRLSYKYDTGTLKSLKYAYNRLIMRLHCDEITSGWEGVGGRGVDASIKWGQVFMLINDIIILSDIRRGKKSAVRPSVVFYFIILL